MTVNNGRGGTVDVTVSRGPKNTVRINGACDNHHEASWSRSLSVHGAAKIMRVLRGLGAMAQVGCGVEYDPIGVQRFTDPEIGYMLYDRDEMTRFSTLCVLDQASADALQFSLGKAIVDSVYSAEREVWILLSTGLLTGDAAVDGADQIGTRAFAYSSRADACSHIREFMRPDVVESRPEGAWDEGDETVDDALDSILDSDDLASHGDGMWTYDGTTRSYEWRLVRLGVRP